MTITAPPIALPAWRAIRRVLTLSGDTGQPCAVVREITMHGLAETAERSAWPQATARGARLSADDQRTGVDELR
jgi:hypothetical protein